MKRTLPLSSALAALFLVAPGASQGQPGGAAPPAGRVKAPMTAVCAVCGVREKAGPEPVAATYEYQGKTYYFCTQACKEEFCLDPEKWIRSAAEPATENPRAGASAVPT
jgi:Cu+-exporting ATPase